jgi:hypothetical protein
MHTHTCMHTQEGEMFTIHTYMHRYIHTPIYTYTQEAPRCIHTHIHAYVHTYTHIHICTGRRRGPHRWSLFLQGFEGARNTETCVRASWWRGDSESDIRLSFICMERWQILLIQIWINEKTVCQHCDSETNIRPSFVCMERWQVLLIQIWINKTCANTVYRRVVAF